jgi:hypothetical protein
LTWISWPGQPVGRTLAETFAAKLVEGVWCSFSLKQTTVLPAKQPRFVLKSQKILSAASERKGD